MSECRKRQKEREKMKRLAKLVCALAAIAAAPLAWADADVSGAWESLMRENSRFLICLNLIKNKFDKDKAVSVFFEAF